MGTFLKTEKALFQIKTLLLQNTNLRKLLYNTVPSALEETAPTVSEVEELITLTPYLENDEGVANSYKNAFIAIYPTRFNIDNIGDVIQIAISVFVSKDYYELDNERLRVFSILEECEKTLDNVKLEFAGKLELQNAAIEVLDVNKYIGYITGWEVVNGKDREF
jgi:hypothetical protein